MKNSCIVLEGGGLRGAFTSGVLEYLLEREYFFNRVIGVSAGACVGASYISKQRGRNIQTNVQFPSDKRYMGFRHLLRSGSYFNMQFIFDELPKRLVPFDEQTFYANPVEFDIVTTSMENGQSIIFNKKEQKQISVEKILVASSSIPLMSPPVEINGRLYFDGGVSDSIPARYALEKHEKAVVVLTRPKGYRKEAMKGERLFRMKYRKHPEFLQTLLDRNHSYNETLAYCEQMEQEGRLFIIAPSDQYSISRTEKNQERRMALYHHGYQLMKQEFEKMKEWVNC